MTIVVTGSIASDHLMTFPGSITDQLLDKHLDKVSLSFLVDELHVYRGGIGGNIAFGLGYLGQAATVVGAVGADFDEYRTWLETHGVDTSHVHVSATRHTARFMCTTDTDNNQIASFYAGAMAEAAEIDLLRVIAEVGDARMVVIGADDPAAMIQHTESCRTAGTPFVADPSQQLARMDGPEIRRLVAGAHLLFTNEYERGLLLQKTGWSDAEVLDQVGTWVVTLGADGLDIISDGAEPIHVAAVADVKTVDPTGVGDACRAGVLAALSYGLDLPRAAQVGCVLASFALETVGTQEYHFTSRDFVARMGANYEEQAAQDAQELLSGRLVLPTKS